MPDHAMGRRCFLLKAGQGLAGAACAVAFSGFALPPAFAQRLPPKKGSLMLTYPFTLPDLPYAHDALAPVIDAETMAIHHSKHHKAYIDKLNEALKDHGELQNLPLPDLVAMVHEAPESIRDAVRNNGGGHANHAMFWSVMGKPGGTGPVGDLKGAIDAAFGSLDELKKKFNAAGVKQFGSGWVFVTLGKDGALGLAAQPNQDTPLMERTAVLFGNDVWEHAYYLTYRNRRSDYLEAWWKVLDWSMVAARYTEMQKGGMTI